MSLSSRRNLAKLWKDGGIEEKWKGTNQFKKRNARKLRAASTDFERFQIQLAKKARSEKRAKA